MAKKHEYFGKYIILDKLASGGMAEVFLARAPSAAGAGRFVALKRILPKFSKDSSFVRMFEQEARVVLQLLHGNIVPIYEFGIEQKRLYLCMGYVHGRNLRQVLKKLNKQKATLPVPFALYVAREVAAGLEYAHNVMSHDTGKSLNITHRDMSPHNIMLDLDGSIKIIDFGIAKAMGQTEKTQHGALKGKFSYMSPEQVAGQSPDKRVDIFALGIVLWEMLSGQRLFLSQNEVESLKKIQACQVPSLASMGIEVDNEVEVILKKALAKDRGDRYQRAGQLQADLSKYINKSFPHFSVKEFADFLNTLYASEAVQMRKLLVEYAKIPFAKKGPLGPSSVGITRTNLTAPPLVPPTSDFHKPQADTKEEPQELTDAQSQASQTQLEPTLTSTEMVDTEADEQAAAQEQKEQEANEDLSQLIANENEPEENTSIAIEDEAATQATLTSTEMMDGVEEEPPPPMVELPARAEPARVEPARAAKKIGSVDKKTGKRPSTGYVREGFNMRLPQHRENTNTNTSTLSSSFARASSQTATGSLTPTLKVPNEQRRVDRAFEVRDRIRDAKTVRVTSPHRVGEASASASAESSASELLRDAAMRSSARLVRSIKAAVFMVLIVGTGVALFLGAQKGAFNFVLPWAEKIIRPQRGLAGEAELPSSRAANKATNFVPNAVFLPVASLPAGANIYMLDKQHNWRNTGLTTPNVVQVSDAHYQIWLVKESLIGYHTLQKKDLQAGAHVKLPLAKTSRQFQVLLAPSQNRRLYNIYINGKKWRKFIPSHGKIELSVDNMIEYEAFNRPLVIEARCKKKRTRGGTTCHDKKLQVPAQVQHKLKLDLSLVSSQ